MQMQAKQMGTQHTPKTTTLFFSVETRKENTVTPSIIFASFLGLSYKSGPKYRGSTYDAHLNSVNILCISV